MNSTQASSRDLLNIVMETTATLSNAQASTLTAESNLCDLVEKAEGWQNFVQIVSIAASGLALVASVVGGGMIAGKSSNGLVDALPNGKWSNIAQGFAKIANGVAQLTQQSSKALSDISGQGVSLGQGGVKTLSTTAKQLLAQMEKELNQILVAMQKVYKS